MVERSPSDPLPPLERPSLSAGEILGRIPDELSEAEVARRKPVTHPALELRLEVFGTAESGSNVRGALDQLAAGECKGVLLEDDAGEVAGVTISLERFMSLITTELETGPMQARYLPGRNIWVPATIESSEVRQVDPNATWRKDRGGM